MQQTTKTAGQTAQDVTANQAEINETATEQSTASQAENLEQEENEESKDSNPRVALSDSLGISDERNDVLVGHVIEAISKMDEDNIEINRSTVITECAKVLPEMTIIESLYIGLVVQKKAEQFLLMREQRRLYAKLAAMEGFHAR
jgi:hypothetical protein